MTFPLFVSMLVVRMKQITLVVKRKIDGKSRVVLPPEVMKALKAKKGDEALFYAFKGHVVIDRKEDSSDEDNPREKKQDL